MENLKVLNNIDIIVETLKNNPTKRSEFVEFMEHIQDPFIVLIACILSLRTNDKTTIGATKECLNLGKNHAILQSLMLKL
ncbi:MAG: hypothetical protein L6V95_08800 [Candidatus Melainabacteria bacterium]|nr:MAG: hypothetical protein L6V95_08800 [Candidatus Melainabacteria bacterium]